MDQPFPALSRPHRHLHLEAGEQPSALWWFWLLWGDFAVYVWMVTFSPCPFGLGFGVLDGGDQHHKHLGTGLAGRPVLTDTGIGTCCFSPAVGRQSNLDGVQVVCVVFLHHIG